LLIDYRLDDGNGLDAILELRRRFGSHRETEANYAKAPPAAESARPGTP